MMCTNAVGCGTSSLDAYSNKMQDLLQSLGEESDSSADTDEEAEEVRTEVEQGIKVLDELFTQIEKRVGPFQVCDGSAMFRTQSAMNHSCDPNTIATYPHNTAQVEIVAVRDISEGEEITMCYVEGIEQEDCPRVRRQAELRQYYLFDCGCIRCQEQAPESSSDSSEE